MTLRLLASLAAGLVFGAGLVVSGMANPAKVQAFLDLGAIPTGGWDPSLAFVMAGALVIAIPGFRLARARARPLFDNKFQWPRAKDIDRKLILGSALFGLGWGLVGFCPGPALTALGLDGTGAVLFVLAMLAGMALHRLGARS
jgi:uncharacterized protein